MINLKYIKRKHKFLGIKEEEFLFGVPVTEEQCNCFLDDLTKLNDEGFLNKYLFYKENVLMLGNVKDKSKKLMELIIDFIPLSDGKKSFTCFGSDWTKCKTHSTTVIHEDINSSWNCLIDYLHHPEFAIILKFKPDEHEFLI
jgi:hypothetical protein